MLTAMPFDAGVEHMMDGHSTQVAFRMTNDFIRKNKYTPEFYNTHEAQKREAFSKIRDEQVARAKYNRQVYDEAKRQKVLNYMGRWDVHRVRRDAVIQGLMKNQQNQLVCHNMRVLGKIILLFQKFNDALVLLRAERERELIEEAKR